MNFFWHVFPCMLIALRRNLLKSRTKSCLVSVCSVFNERLDGTPAKEKKGRNVLTSYKI